MRTLVLTLGLISFITLPQLSYAISPPILNDPENNATVSLSTLSWGSVDQCLQYKVYVDDEPIIASPYIKGPYYTDKTSYSPQLNLGTYYWKVASQAPDKSWADSEIRSFTLEAAPTDTPTPTPQPTPTPEPPTPTHTPTPSKTPTPTSIKVTPSKTPTPSKINSPTPKITKNPNKETLDATETAKLPPSILGSSISQSPTPLPSPTQSLVAAFTFSNLLKVAMVVIFILLGIFTFTFVAKDRFKR